MSAAASQEPGDTRMAADRWCSESSRRWSAKVESHEDAWEAVQYRVGGRWP